MTHEEDKLAKERRKLLVDTNSQLWDRRDSERAFYQGNEYIDVHLITDEIIPCRLIECGQFVLIVELKTKTRLAKALIPKHAIKMIVIKEIDKNDRKDKAQ
jgi:hypothetical protein